MKLQCFSSHPRSPTCTGWRKLSPLETPFEDNCANIIPLRSEFHLSCPFISWEQEIRLKSKSQSWPVLERIFPTWWRMACPVVIHVSLMHWSTPSCTWTAPGTKHLRHSLWQPEKVLAWEPSTHRSELPHLSSALREALQSFHCRARDAVAYTPQEHRLLGEEDMHIRNSDKDQL